MLVDAFIYTGLSSLNQFFCDSAIIDKTLFYEICRNFSNFTIEENGKSYVNPEIHQIRGKFRGYH
jgi:hypothetical protein